MHNAHNETARYLLNFFDTGRLTSRVTRRNDFIKDEEAVTKCVDWIVVRITRLIYFNQKNK